jgi:thiamine-monophosphate kinase
LEVGGTRLVLTHDMIVEGVHFLPHDPPGEVAWKLVAVNLSDLAAKGARPIGALLGYSLGEEAWDRAFADGLGAALSAFGLPLLGGDTVAPPAGTPRSFGLTAIGEAAGPVPARCGARAGDRLWVSGSIGDSAAGLAIARGSSGPHALVDRYRRPKPRLGAGGKLAPLVHAMMDVSDGLLIDASRMAEASGVGFEINLGAIPLSPALIEFAGDSREARLAAASAGDDYELLFAAPADRTAEIAAIAKALALPLTPIGTASTAPGLRLHHEGAPVPLPKRLGWEHVRR